MDQFRNPGGPAGDALDDGSGADPGASFRKPSRLLLLLEGRAAFEAGSFLASWPLLARHFFDVEELPP